MTEENNVPMIFRKGTERLHHLKADTIFLFYYLSWFFFVLTFYIYKGKVHPGTGHEDVEGE